MTDLGKILVGFGIVVIVLGGILWLAGHAADLAFAGAARQAKLIADQSQVPPPDFLRRYRVYFQKIVVSTDWSILNSRPYEKLVLSACHPLYSATHRIVTFARLVGESPKSTL